MKINDRKMNARHIYYMISIFFPFLKIYMISIYTHTHKEHTKCESIQRKGLVHASKKVYCS